MSDCYMSSDDESSGEFDKCNDFVDLLQEFNKIFENMTIIEINQFINEHMKDDIDELFKEYEEIKDELKEDQKVIILEIFRKLGICHKYH